MTERLKQQITIPAWALAIIIPLLFLASVQILFAAKENSRSQATLTTNVKNINERLDRIESKLDNHIIH